MQCPAAGSGEGMGSREGETCVSGAAGWLSWRGSEHPARRQSVGLAGEGTGLPA